MLARELSIIASLDCFRVLTEMAIATIDKTLLDIIETISTTIDQSISENSIFKNKFNTVITSLSRIIIQNLTKNVNREELKEMFRKNETKSLLKARTIALKKAEIKVENLTLENKELYEENKDLRFENEEQRELIDRIIRLATSNTYNNEKSILNKIKELISDYHSQN